jgi:hypothetical protein
VHTARLLRGEAEMDLAQIELAPGGSGTLTLSLKAPSAEQTAQSAVQDAKPSPVVLVSTSDAPRADSSDKDRRKRRMWWGIGAGAVAVIAGAVIAGVLLSHRSKDPQPYNGNFEPGSVSVKVNP